MVSQNTEQLVPILSSIFFSFYCTHHIALRGKDSKTGNLRGVLDFKIETGDKVLKKHVGGANKNSQHTSPQFQKELIGIAEEVLRAF